MPARKKRIRGPEWHPAVEVCQKPGNQQGRHASRQERKGVAARGMSRQRPPGQKAEQDGVDRVGEQDCKGVPGHGNFSECGLAPSESFLCDLKKQVFTSRDNRKGCREKVSCFAVRWIHGVFASKPPYRKRAGFAYSSNKACPDLLRPDYRSVRAEFSRSGPGMPV